MNVLLTCVGRRNYLVEYFRQAVGDTGFVFGTDVSSEAPGMQEVDKAFVLPRVDAPGYVDCLLTICREHSVGLLASVNDLELPILAPTRERFEAIGTRLVVSAPEVIDIAFDKWRTVAFLSQHGVKSPLTVLRLDDAYKELDAGRFRFPLVVKPRWGTASVSIDIVRDRKELELAFQLTHKRLSQTMLADISLTDLERSVMIQECLDGHEYGLDVVNDLEGRNVTTFVKRKLAMRAGETDRAVTEVNVELFELGCLIGRRLKHVGNLDCDVFLTSNGPCVLELNPRFGGGYPFTQMAGANIPAALVAWCLGTSHCQSGFRRNRGSVVPNVTAWSRLGYTIREATLQVNDCRLMPNCILKVCVVGQGRHRDRLQSRPIWRREVVRMKLIGIPNHPCRFVG